MRHVLEWAGLELSFQRLGKSAWSPHGLLRSWAPAPWQRSPDGVVVACLPEEVLWLGISCRRGPAVIRLRSRHGGGWRELAVPPDWQLGWVESHAGKRPIALRKGCHAVYFRLDVRCAGCERASLDLTLLAPAAWQARFGPVVITPAVEPPPVERYSHVVDPSHD